MGSAPERDVALVDRRLEIVDVEIRCDDDGEPTDPVVVGDTITCTAAEFLMANADDPDLVREVLALDVGDDLTAGGGAAPLITIRRIA